MIGGYVTGFAPSAVNVMAKAWGILISGSTLQSGDAWEHLNAQGGGGTCDTLVLTDGLEVEVDACEFEIEIMLPEYDIEVADGYEIELENNELEIEVCDA